MMDKENKQSFEDILSKALSLWPENIVITERVRIGDTDRVHCAALVKIHDGVEAHLMDLKDDFQWIMDGAIYRALHAAAKYLNCLRLHELNRDYLRELFEHNLFTEENFIELRKQYAK